MFAKSWAVLLRQLPLVIVALLLALAAGAGAFLLTPPTQESEAAVLFVPSVKQPGVEGPTNPLLFLGNSVSIVASIVQIAVSDDETAKRIYDAGHTAKYEVVPDLGQNSGPVLLITTQDRTVAQSQGTRDAIVAEIGTRLRAIQDERSVAADLRVTMVTLVSSVEPKPIHKTQIQFAFVAFAVVLGGAVLVLLQVGARADRRARRRPSTRNAGRRPPRDTQPPRDHGTLPARVRPRAPARPVAPPDAPEDRDGESQPTEALHGAVGTH